MLQVLDRMEKTEIFPLDQVCYRILIELCGKYDQPEMAVKVMRAMQRAGLEQNAVTYGIYHRAVMDATWPSPARQKAIRMWNSLRIVVTASEALMKWANVERRPLTMLDTQSVSDGGYHSDNKVPEVVVPQAEITVDYEITSYPLDTLSKKESVDSEIMDPLGAMELNNHEKKERSKSLGKIGMSPSRAKFFADHATLPFSNENTPKADKQNNSKGSGWLKGIANSPMFKMIRSTTFGKFHSKESRNSLSNSQNHRNHRLRRVVTLDQSLERAQAFIPWFTTSRKATTMLYHLDSAWESRPF